MSDEQERIEVVDLEFRSDTGHGRGSKNTKLLLGGQDITKFCSAFSLTADVSSLVTAEIRVLAREGFDLRLPVAVVAATIMVYPGFVLIEEESEGRKRWRVEREHPAEAKT